MRTSALIALPLLLGTAAPAGAVGDPQVAATQAALVQRGFYAGSVDGMPGPATADAIVALQRARGLAPDGVLGPRTRRALGPLGRHKLGTRILHKGQRGFDVAELQFELAWHGFPCAVFDGKLGPHTAAALRHFQKWAGFVPDGLAGPQTLAALRRPMPRSALRLARPVAGLIGSPFGPRGDSFHPGVDIVAPVGMPVRSAAPGRVIRAEWFDGYGELVVVAHGYGITTWYAHLSRLDVQRGDRVALGEQLGLVGETGNATGPHLHFEERVRGAAIDPVPALR